MFKCHTKEKHFSSLAFFFFLLLPLAVCRLLLPCCCLRSTSAHLTRSSCSHIPAFNILSLLRFFSLHISQQQQWRSISAHTNCGNFHVWRDVSSSFHLPVDYTTRMTTTTRFNAVFSRLLGSREYRKCSHHHILRVCHNAEEWDGWNNIIACGNVLNVVTFFLLLSLML